MSEPTQFSLSTLGRRRAPGLPEFEAILDLLPKAAILVDSQTFRINSANARASELTTFTRAELADLDLRTLFTHPDDTALKKPELFEPRTVTLNRRNGSKVLVRLLPATIPTKAKWVILTLEEEVFLQRIQAEQQRSKELWENLQLLASALQQPDLETSINLALLAARDLTGAGLVALYRANNNSPEVDRFIGLGEIKFLPEKLSPLDLTALAKPHLWIPGKRHLSDLHRVGHSMKLNYMATAPIGQSKAIIGLLVVAGTQTHPPDHLFPILQLLADTFTTILHRAVLTSHLEGIILEQERNLRLGSAVEEIAHDGLLILSPDLKAIRINPAAEAMLGYSTPEVTDQPVNNILIGTESLLPALKAAQEGSAANTLENLRIFRRNGEAFLAQVHTMPVLKNGNLDGIIILIKDLSEQEQIREHTQQLEQHAILGEITAIFAHEVRNPINNISTGMQLLALNLPEEDPNQQMITRLQQDCDRLAELMKSILSFSKPAEYEMENMDIGQLIQRLLERMQLRMERAYVKFHLQADPKLPCILGNPRALEQVFNNLFTNAIQAMSETGGHLAIKVQRLDGPEGRSYIEVSVADTGPGIPKEQQERIFQAFFTTNRNGTGLGLAIAKRIITAHKGNINVTSFPGGTIFHVKIPVAD
jgi:two-component system sensor histidine kinase AtoS